MKATTPKHNDTTPNLGIDEDVLAKVHDILNVYLANVYVLAIKTKKMHWDVVGPQFLELHKVWDTQYEKLNLIIDEAAERIRQLGGFPLATLEGFLAATELEESPGQVPRATDAVSILLVDQERVIRSLRDTIEQTDELGDIGTSDFLVGNMRKHEKMAWILRSFLQGEAIQPVTSTSTATRDAPPLA